MSLEEFRLAWDQLSLSFYVPLLIISIYFVSLLYLESNQELCHVAPLSDQLF